MALPLNIKTASFARLKPPEYLVYNHVSNLEKTLTFNALADIQTFVDHICYPVSNLVSNQVSRIINIKIKCHYANRNTNS